MGCRTSVGYFLSATVSMTSQVQQLPPHLDWTSFLNNCWRFWVQWFGSGCSIWSEIFASIKNKQSQTNPGKKRGALWVPVKQLFIAFGFWQVTSEIAFLRRKARCGFVTRTRHTILLMQSKTLLVSDKLISFGYFLISLCLRFDWEEISGPPPCEFSKAMNVKTTSKYETNKYAEMVALNKSKHSSPVGLFWE